MWHVLLCLHFLSVVGVNAFANCNLGTLCKGDCNDPFPWQCAKQIRSAYPVWSVSIGQICAQCNRKVGEAEALSVVGLWGQCGETVLCEGVFGEEGKRAVCRMRGRVYRCMPETTTVNGRACETASQCLSTLVGGNCAAGICAPSETRKCSADDQCPDRQCFEGRCYPMPRFCSENRQCQTFQRCLGGLCSSPDPEMRECRESTECWRGYLCWRGMCKKVVQPGDTCGDGDVCLLGRQHVDCIKGECRWRSQGEFCEGGTCQGSLQCVHKECRAPKVEEGAVCDGGELFQETEICGVTRDGMVLGCNHYATAACTGKTEEDCTSDPLCDLRPLCPIDSPPALNNEKTCHEFVRSHVSHLSEMARKEGCADWVGQHLAAFRAECLRGVCSKACPEAPQDDADAQPVDSDTAPEGQSPQDSTEPMQCVRSKLGWCQKLFAQGEGEYSSPLFCAPHLFYNYETRRCEQPPSCVVQEQCGSYPHASPAPVWVLGNARAELKQSMYTMRWGGCVEGRCRPIIPLDEECVEAHVNHSHAFARESFAGNEAVNVEEHAERYHRAMGCCSKGGHVLQRLWGDRSCDGKPQNRTRVVVEFHYPLKGGMTTFLESVSTVEEAVLPGLVERCGVRGDVYLLRACACPDCPCLRQDEIASMSGNHPSNKRDGPRLTEVYLAMAGEVLPGDPVPHPLCAVPKEAQHAKAHIETVEYRKRHDYDTEVKERQYVLTTYNVREFSTPSMESNIARELEALPGRKIHKVYIDAMCFQRSFDSPNVTFCVGSECSDCNVTFRVAITGTFSEDDMHFYSLHPESAVIPQGVPDLPTPTKPVESPSESTPTPTRTATVLPTLTATAVPPVPLEEILYPPRGTFDPAGALSPLLLLFLLPSALAAALSW